MVNFNRLLPSTWATRCFLAMTALETIVNSTMLGLILRAGDLWHGLFDSRIDQAGNADSTLAAQQILPVYLAIFAMAHVFQFVLAADAIYNRNTIQRIGLALFNLLFLAYAIQSIQEVRNAFEQINRLSNDIDIYVTVIPCMIGVAQAVYFVCSWFIYKEFGWEVFKHLGADRRIKRMYFAYQVFICICKFDFFFIFAFSLQFISLVLKKADIERWLTIAAAPVSLILAAAGFISARKEIKWLMGVFMSGCVLGMGYFAFKLFRIFQNQNQQYSQVKKSLTTFSVISLIALLVTVFQATIVFRNFGKGLKFHLTIKKHSKATPKPDDSGYADDMSDHGLHYKLESANSSRMSID